MQEIEKKIKDGIKTTPTIQPNLESVVELLSPKLKISEINSNWKTINRSIIELLHPGKTNPTIIGNVLVDLIHTDLELLANQLEIGFNQIDLTFNDDDLKSADPRSQDHPAKLILLLVTKKQMNQAIKLISGIQQNKISMVEKLIEHHKITVLQYETEMSMLSQKAKDINKNLQQFLETPDLQKDLFASINDKFKIKMNFQKPKTSLQAANQILQNINEIEKKKYEILHN